jgi:hypothetical protein
VVFLPSDHFWGSVAGRPASSFENLS